MNTRDDSCAKETFSEDIEMFDEFGYHDFDSNPSTTKVSFNHASIGDSFRNKHETVVSMGNGCPSVRINYHKARISVLRRYFEILNDHKFPKENIALILRPCAREAIVPLLSTINIAGIDKRTSEFLASIQRDFLARNRS
ncbi:Tetratricopeptide-like helical [Penicillium cf. griseofulvum]|uniref:Tetratricopeptide-like helical n=1 Tax=Penicillium cf. griseofulvum TaxID=2972120 RepID=A0A9W9N084_9EURO|nr:Tetratricopeptide-like helical [Penicillium cf. griseofulvum]KAJ5421791.1 Tetratricopeptide-like helical [Penicillium cf. griseofulvum]